jgi:hypothetical protein
MNIKLSYYDLLYFHYKMRLHFHISQAIGLDFFITSSYRLNP